MNPHLKPTSLILYLLAFPTSFIIGAILTGLSGVAKGQGLAGGAIVFFYAMIGGIVGLLMSIYYVKKVENSKIIRINKLLTALLIISISLLTYRYKSQQNKKTI